MSSELKELFACFREDHVVLGKGFHAIAECLRSGDMAGASEAARELDREAGAHIAFEEEELYPALGTIFGEERALQMRGEHQEGLEVIRTLTDEASGQLPDQTRAGCLEKVERMQDHIAECGQLFEAISRLPLETQQGLLTRLLEWRGRRPSWKDHAAGKP